MNQAFPCHRHSLQLVQEKLLGFIVFSGFPEPNTIKYRICATKGKMPKAGIRKGTNRRKLTRPIREKDAKIKREIPRAPTKGIVNIKSKACFRRLPDQK